MPKRPLQHVIGDQAAAAVQNVIAQAGYSVQTVSQDYGEDLLVQPSHAGQMDANRLWIQVKGTESIDSYRRKTGFAYSVSFDQALRWARSADPVVVVLWDLSAETGYFAWPRGQVSEWSHSETGKQSTTLRFRPDDVFDVDGVRRIAWDARVLHFRHLILDAKDAEEDLRQEAGPDSGELKAVSGRRLLVTLDFMHTLGLVKRRTGPPEEFRVKEEVHKDFVATVKEMVAGGEPVVDAIDQAVLYTILLYADKASGGLGLDTAAIAAIAEVFHPLLGLTDIEELQELQRQREAERSA